MIVRKNLKLGASFIGRYGVFLLLLDVAIAVGYVFGKWTWLAVPDVPLSIFGGIIGVITGFRNSSAYARWWEARTIWGGIVNSSRSFARQVLTMVIAPESDAEEKREVCEIKRKLVLHQIAYVHALRNQLRGLPVWPDLSGLICEEELKYIRTQSNAALAIQQRMSSMLSGCFRRGWIEPVQWACLDRTLSILMDGQGASERIKNTPMPRMYDFFIRLFIKLFCMLLPLGMVASLKLWTPLGSTFVAFMFLALDRMGGNLETPFENSPHDISLTAITRTIEINLKEMIDEQEIPAPVAPIDGILW